MLCYYALIFHIISFYSYTIRILCLFVQFLHYWYLMPTFILLFVYSFSPTYIYNILKPNVCFDHPRWYGLVFEDGEGCSVRNAYIDLLSSRRDKTIKGHFATRECREVSLSLKGNLT